jgi:hypothetical protein
MNRTTEAVLWALPPIVLLIIIPLILISNLPLTIINIANALLGMGIFVFVTDLAVFGIVLAALSALQTWAYPWSVLKPIASSLHMIVSYTLLLFFLGLGNPLTFGIADIGLSPAALSGFLGISGAGPGVGTINISVISTFIALLFGIAWVMRIAQKFLIYSEEKIFHSLELQGSGGAQVLAPVAQGQEQSQVKSQSVQADDK